MSPNDVNRDVTWQLGQSVMVGFGSGSRSARNGTATYHNSVTNGRHVSKLQKSKVTAA